MALPLTLHIENRTHLGHDSEGSDKDSERWTEGCPQRNTWLPQRFYQGENAALSRPSFSCPTCPTIPTTNPNASPTQWPELWSESTEQSDNWRVKSNDQRLTNITAGISPLLGTAHQLHITINHTRRQVVVGNWESWLTVSTNEPTDDTTVRTLRYNLCMYSLLLCLFGKCFHWSPIDDAVHTR